MKNNILVCWMGRFGFALLKHLDSNINYEKYNLYWWDIDSSLIWKLKETGKNNFFQKDFEVSNKVNFISNLEEILPKTNILIIWIKSDAINSFLENYKKYINNWTILLNVAKWLSPNWKTFSEEIPQILNWKNIQYTVLSWGTKDLDLLEWNPVWVSIGTKDKEAKKLIYEIFYNEKNFYTQFFDDTKWVEFAGIFKNLGSILTWYINWSWKPLGTQTYYLTKFCEEINHIANSHLQTSSEIFDITSQCRGNDLFMSAFGQTRNNEFWNLLGKGIKFEDAHQIMKLQRKTIEWVNTINFLEKLINTYNINTARMPIINWIINFRYNKFFEI